MTLAAAERRTTSWLSPPSTPRLRLGQTGSDRTLLDGAWWPGSTDPVAELPGLVSAIDALRGPVTRLMLNVRDWDSHPRRLEVPGRVVRLAYSDIQPTGLLTALCGSSGGRVDLLVVPADTAGDVAGAAMALAATAGNRVHAQHILHTISTVRTVEMPPEEMWEDEGGSLANSRRRIRSM